jgi:hypothetical protein
VRGSRVYCRSDQASHPVSSVQKSGFSDEVTSVPSPDRRLCRVSVNLYGRHPVVYVALTTHIQSSRTVF